VWKRVPGLETSSRHPNWRISFKLAAKASCMQGAAKPFYLKSLWEAIALSWERLCRENKIEGNFPDVKQKLRGPYEEASLIPGCHGSSGTLPSPSMATKSSPLSNFFDQYYNYHFDTYANHERWKFLILQNSNHTDLAI